MTKFLLNWLLFSPILALLAGCFGYRDVVDPYYPKRYSVQARNSVRGLTQTQVNNGTILDKTVWDFYFEKGTADINPMGQTHLKRLAQERPQPCCVVFLQTAQSPPAGKEPAKAVEALREAKSLDDKRKDAILAYMNALTEGRDHPEFQIVVHDPPEVYGNGVLANLAIRGIATSVSGSLRGGSGSGGSSQGGGSGGSGSP